MDEFKPSPALRPLLPDVKRPFIHRDLSWLEFNSRVLGEARLKSNPLLERVKFLSISASNLDEFFMIRMASLRRSISAAVRKGDKDLVERLTRIHATVLKSAAMTLRRQALCCDELADALAPVGIQAIFNIKANPEIEALAKATFDKLVLPDLAPPEPFVRSSILNLGNLQTAVIFKDTWLKIPKKIRTVLAAESASGVCFFFLDQLLAEFVGPAFRLDGKPVVLRLTRDGDVTVDLDEEDSESIPDIVRSTLGTREKGRAVRLQYLGADAGLSPSPEGKAAADLVASLASILKLRAQQVLWAPKTFCLQGLWGVLSSVPEAIASKPGLLYPQRNAPIPKKFQDLDRIFEKLRERDFLLHHPYDSFGAYVNWIRASCADPLVTSIDMTVYRMDALSPIIELLKSAAQAKKVRVVIELRARFDELNNLRLADELRKAGVEVAFGFGKLKLHAKVTVVERIENGITRRYTHLSTGNYNSVTARQYTDLAVMTADPVIGEDVRTFFDSLLKGEVPLTFKRLVAAPGKLHRLMQQLIELEIAAARSGLPARIVVKVNALVDEAVIESLYRASGAGVRVDLIIRGACSLIPGVPGLSQNIRVISIVDRYLEHSRIYYFENSRALYLSSADWMPRNFYSRLELAFPVLDDRIYRHIAEVVIPAHLNDNVKARELTSDGSWKKLAPTDNETARRSQLILEDVASKHYEGTPLEDTHSDPSRPQG